MHFESIEEQWPSERQQFRVSRLPAERHEQPESLRRTLSPPVTDDDEMRRIARAVIWLVVVAITPLILLGVLAIF